MNETSQPRERIPPLKSAAIRNFIIREHDNWLTAAENARMRYGMFGVAVIVAVTVVEIAWELSEASVYFFGPLMALGLIGFAAAVRPWHTHLRLDRDERTLVVSRRLLLLPFTSRRHELTGKVIERRTVHWQHTIKVDAPDDETSAADVVGCLLGLVLGPLGMLLSAARSKPKVERTVARTNIELHVVETATGGVRAVLRAQSAAELDDLVDALRRVAPEFVSD